MSLAFHSKHFILVFGTVQIFVCLERLYEDARRFDHSYRKKATSPGD